MTQNEDYPKYALNFVHEEDSYPPLAFFALTVDPALEADFAFYCQRMTEDHAIALNLELPTIQGVMRKSEQYIGNEIFQFDGMG